MKTVFRGRQELQEQHPGTRHPLTVEGIVTRDLQVNAIAARPIGYVPRQSTRRVPEARFLAPTHRKQVDKIGDPVNPVCLNVNRSVRNSEFQGLGHTFRQGLDFDVVVVRQLSSLWAPILTEVCLTRGCQMIHAVPLVSCVISVYEEALSHLPTVLFGLFDSFNQRALNPLVGGCNNLF